MPVGTSRPGPGFWRTTRLDFGPVTFPSLQPARLINALASARVLPFNSGTVQVVIAPGERPHRRYDPADGHVTW